MRDKGSRDEVVAPAARHSAVRGESGEGEDGENCDDFAQRKDTKSSDKTGFTDGETDAKEQHRAENVEEAWDEHAVDRPELVLLLFRFRWRRLRGRQREEL